MWIAGKPTEIVQVKKKNITVKMIYAIQYIDQFGKYVILVFAMKKRACVD